MSPRKVRFSMPLTSEELDTTSVGESLASDLRKTALAKWWGNFVPMDQWTPPNIQHTFKDLPFRKYNMTPETRIDSPDNAWGDSTLDIYDRNFAGVEEAIHELSVMFEDDWVKSRSQPPLVGSPPTTESIDEEELMDCDGPLYDLGWDGISSVSQEVRPPSEQGMTADNGPIYDLGWSGLMYQTLSVIDHSATHARLPSLDSTSACKLVYVYVGRYLWLIEHCKADGINQSPVYDLGWTLDPIPPSVVPADEIEEDPVYNLRWSCPTMLPEEAEATDDNDDPAYNLSWVATMVESAAMDNDVIDLTIDETPEPSAWLPMEEEVMDLTEEYSPVYDLGWGSMADATSGHCSPIRMDMDVHSTSLSIHAREAEDNIFQMNCLMKAIGNDMTNEHVRAIVENAVYGLNDSCIPDQILFDNRQIFGMFADLRNRVTEVGLDICKLHGMIQLQRRLLRTVDSVIASLEDNDD
ncbi:uncharacterized protein F5891DRAFT_986424 [Suillus fuscotomentosus]|uniref:Uncharacterized protein n=1 Tax=Suillus fuscotomentosus TaxID=1912939 RepID=A0AAD4HCR6_9AGAM|nr:uncharacterized protein F5891DRAFT_986424 [Suillus fuscotomentosus]KAG1891930.1 hypothetical protein F5891DRAFT_986424 [Suillus fuscotomentosus]